MNCSIRMLDLPLTERFRRARAEGFGAVEVWWPFAGPVPGRTELVAFLDALVAADVDLVACNLWAGDMGAGERGVLHRDDVADDLAAHLEVVAAIADATGCRLFNTLLGRGYGGEAGAGADLDIARRRNLDVVADRLAEVGGTALIEPLSGMDDYPVRTVEDALWWASRVGTGVLADFFHLAVNGVDVPASIGAHGRDFAHVQIADVPGRGAPGTGEAPIGDWLEALDVSGYRGRIAVEYLD